MTNTNNFPAIDINTLELVQIDEKTFEAQIDEKTKLAIDVAFWNEDGEENRVTAAVITEDQILDSTNVDDYVAFDNLFGLNKFFGFLSTFK